MISSKAFFEQGVGAGRLGTLFLLLWHRRPTPGRDLCQHRPQWADSDGGRPDVYPAVWTEAGVQEVL